MGISAFSASLRRKLAPLSLRSTKHPPSDSKLQNSPVDAKLPHHHHHLATHKQQPLAAAPVPEPDHKRPEPAHPDVAPRPHPKRSSFRWSLDLPISPRKSLESRRSLDSRTLPSRQSARNTIRAAQRRARSKDCSATDVVVALSSFDTVPQSQYTTAVADRLCSDDDLMADFLHALVDPNSPAVAAVDQLPSPSTSLVPPRSDATAAAAAAAAAFNAAAVSRDNASTAPMQPPQPQPQPPPPPPPQPPQQEPPAEEDARSRLRTAWVVSTFLRHGPPQLRAALAAHKAHIRKLASVFDAPPTTLDPARATLVADLLRGLLHAHPRESATVLSDAAVLRAMLRHAALPPVADLLPRLVGTRPFPAGRIVAAHKRAVVGLAASGAPAHLCAAAQSALRAADAARLAALVGALAEIGARAAQIPRRFEDADERTDAMYVPTFGVITSAAYNDAANDMDLTATPAPLLDVLDAALAGAAGDPALLLPVLYAVETVLRAADGAPKPQALAEALPKFVPGLVALLENGAAASNGNTAGRDGGGGGDGGSGDGGQKKAGFRVGSVRVATLDIVTAAAECLPRESLAGIFAKDRCALLRGALDLAARAPHNDVVATGVGRLLTALFERGDAALVGTAAQHANVVQAAHSRVAERPVAACVKAAARWAGAGSSDGDGDDNCDGDGDGDGKRKDGEVEKLEVDNATRAELAEMAAAVRAEQEEDDGDSFGSAARAGMQKNAGLSGEMLSVGDPGASEDYGHELFVMGAVHEAGRGHGTAPPSDGVADSVTSFLWHAADRLHAHHQDDGPKQQQRQVAATAT